MNTTRLEPTTFESVSNSLTKHQKLENDEKKVWYSVLASKDLVKPTLHFSFMFFVLSRVQETICESLGHWDFEGPKTFSDSFFSSTIFLFCDFW